MSDVFYCPKCHCFVNRKPFHPDRFCVRCYDRDARETKLAKKKEQRELEITRRILLISDISVAMALTGAAEKEDAISSVVNYVQMSHDIYYPEKIIK